MQAVLFRKLELISILVSLVLKPSNQLRYRGNTLGCVEHYSGKYYGHFLKTWLYNCGSDYSTLYLDQLSWTWGLNHLEMVM